MGFKDTLYHSGILFIWTFTKAAFLQMGGNIISSVLYLETIFDNSSQDFYGAVEVKPCRFILFYLFHEILWILRAELFY
jgi:hypothetical protein